MKYLVTILALMSTLTLSCLSAPPNIVFITVDDLGWTDLGCYGSQYYETPKIDRLASEGMRFSNGYSCGANCQPSRAAFLSGQLMPATGTWTVLSRDLFDWSNELLEPVENNFYLRTNKVTYGRVVKSAGYTTGYYGKWHLSNGHDKFHPLRHGFDEAVTVSGNHFGFQTQPETPYQAGTYLPDFLTDKALEFIDRNKSNTFCLTVSYFEPHAPYEAKAEWINYFANKSPVGGHTNPVYAAMISSVDEGVGRIIQGLADAGLTTNTVVIFYSDNGGLSGQTSNLPLREGKGSFYEGGTRVPLIVKWPGMIATNVVSDVPVYGVDIYSTIREISGGTIPEGYPVHGKSFLDVLTNTTYEARPPLYWHLPGYIVSDNMTWVTKPLGVIREGSWKLMEFFEDGRLELYNLDTDIGETNDLSSQFPLNAATLQAKLAAWRQELGAPMPVLNISAPPVITSQPDGVAELSQGERDTFVVAVSGSPVMSYQWRLNGTNILNANKSSYTRANAGQASIGNYSVLVSNAYGSVVSDDAYLSVKSRWPVSVAGKYSGLFYQPSGVNMASAGFVSFTLSEWGIVSGGRLVLECITNNFSMTLSSNGFGQSIISRPDLSPIIVEINCSPTNSSGVIMGTVSDGLWVADLIVDIAASPSELVEMYTMGFYNGPIEHGYGLMTLTNSLVRFTGGFMDGSPLTQTIAMSVNGMWPLYSTMSSGGVIMGWISNAFPKLTGDAVWLRSLETTPLSVRGVTFVPPPYGQRITNGVISYTGYLNCAVQTAFATFTLNANNVTIFALPNANQFKLSFSTVNGNFTGSFVMAGVTNSFKGAVIQESPPSGVGVLLGSTNYGMVTITSLP